MNPPATRNARPSRLPRSRPRAAGSGTVLVTLLMALLSCVPTPDPGPAQDALLRDSAGVVIVENRRPDPRAVLPEVRSLSATPRLSIGSEDGVTGTPLFRVRGSVRLSDGRVVVANGGTSELFFFSREGQLEMRVGGAGGGPAEFAPLGGLPVGPSMIAALPGDTIVAHDGVGGKILVLAPDGEFLRSSRLREAGGLRTVELATGVGWLDDGTVLVTTSRRADSTVTAEAMEGMLRPWLVLRRFGPDGGEQDAIGTFPGNQRYTRVRNNLDRSGTGTIRIGSSPVPFAHRFLAASRGSRVAVGITDRSEIMLFGTEGRLQRLVRGSVAQRAVTEADRDAWVVAHGGTPPVVPFPEMMPAFETLMVDDQRRLWVEIYRPAPASGPSRWIVHDDEGRRLGEVTMPDGFRPLEIGRDYVLGVWKDEWEVEFVQLYDLHTPPK